MKEFIVYRKVNKQNEWESGRSNSLQQAVLICDAGAKSEPGVTYRVYQLGKRGRAIGQPVHFARSEK